MEMVSEEPDDERVRSLFDDIKKTQSAQSVNSDYRTLALWPGYLEAAWRDLKPIVETDAHRRRASDGLRELARQSARSLPYPVLLSREDVNRLGEDPDDVLETTESFERLLPPLIVNIALLSLEWRTADELARSPFPAGARVSAKTQQGGAHELA
jgi:hypothetical protein